MANKDIFVPFPFSFLQYRQNFDVVIKESYWFDKGNFKQNLILPIRAK